ncbi:putative WRKY transcription factor 27 [Hibiscus syriacus]|uniref:WRKY transcription factor 27 n=1 Tax=Hibiscus syriacus TaxID=106335 RepID=A0A6A3D3R1_HIBSY|nr:probable WRKY transcription factor 27 [Hibiscus syriacus]KAE8733899.1 putative WRKY transcription factor 27 [Hibiscus syriacus]
MAEDWDLYAIVRSCTSAAANSSRDAAVESNNNNNENCGSFREDPLACLASLTFEEEDDPFTFKSGSLHDSYKPFLPNVDPTTIIATNRGIDPCSSSSVHGQLNQYHEQPTTTSTAAAVGIGSLLTLSSPSILAFSGFRNQQQFPQSEQQQLQQRVQPPAQNPRSRKRKNQLKRNVCHVKAYNLSSDPWAWRKYGQKPIKGSPYPRNYYRCSSSKGCSARKQVERSNTDPNIFIVTYTGEHTHPKPTHRNSLAGSTRNKVSTPTVQKAAIVKDSAVETMPITTPCSSPRSGNNLSPISPTTPLSAPEEAAASLQNAGEDESVDMAFETTLGGESNDEVDLLIPNVHVDEDLFKGFEELVGSGSGRVGRSPNFGDNFSSWSSVHSAATGAAASGGC